jgi:hypothetical protein
MTDIRREHPEYVARKAMWKAYRDLYVGGDQLKRNASQYLVQRHKEPPQVYGERLDRVFYENYVGSIIDWYAATLFRREPVLTFEGSNERGKRFFTTFMDDCDLKGTNLTEFFRRQLVEALVNGVSYTLVDFPRPAKRPGNRAEEDATGASRAYFVSYRAEDLINWRHDDRGVLESVVLRTSHLREGQAGEWVPEVRWVRYDRERFAVFQPSGDGIARVDEGYHALALQKRVPLFEMRVTDGLWLMNKAGLLQLEHFNKSNALGWALTMGLYAMPVIYSQRDWNQVMGESYYIQLAPEDRFGWTEPEGKVYQIAAENLVRLKDEIYRVCYLLSQAGGPMAGITPQSGLSKQRDFAITQEILRAYGDTVKDTIKTALRAVDQARGDGLAIDVAGLDEFDIGDFTSELTDAERLLALGIDSPTLRRQIFKRLALKYLCDVRPHVKEQISTEIDKWVG